MQTPKINYSKLTAEQRDKLDAHQKTEKQFQVLSDIADITQELLNVADDSKKINELQFKQLGAVLTDAREQLVAINKKETPESPDFSTPVVKAINKLYEAFNKLELKVDAPVVNVSPASVSVDLKGIEKILKTEIPKAFNESITLIPPTVIPETPDRWDEVLEWLSSIDTASRMKPQFPSGLATAAKQDSMITAIGNISGTSRYTTLLDETTTTNVTYIGKAVLTGSSIATSSAAWQISKFDESGSVSTLKYADGDELFNNIWDNRASLTYN